MKGIEKAALEYKLVYLNKGLSGTREKDYQKAEDKINETVSEGWILQQVVSPADGMGSLVGIFYRERKL